MIRTKSGSMFRALGLAASAGVALAALVSSAGCGSETALVGGRCRDGLVAEGSTCRRPGTGPGDTAASATEPPLAGTVDPEAETTSGVVEVTSDASAPVLTIADDAAVPLAPSFVDAGLETADADVELVCTSPLVACRGSCIPVHADPANCGACGKSCPSNICVNGECQGATPGDIVLVGHDFAEAWEGSAQAKVLVNAVAIATTDPVRVLTWEDGASDASVASVKALVRQGLQNRRVQYARASASTLTADSLATSYDVVLLFDGAGPDPVTLGASWASGLGRFAQKGGVVIALDGAASGMPALVTAAGLLDVPAHEILSVGAHLVVTAPNDVVGRQVLSPYAAAGVSVAFPSVSAPSSDVTWVVRAGEDAGLGAPVVVHRTVR